MSSGTQMLQRRGTAAEWASVNPVLGDGELGFAEDTRDLKIGDGTTPWNDLESLANLLSRVAKIGDTMTGRLRLPELGTETGDTLAIYEEDGGSLANLQAGEIYDSGSRVYSENNPPPEGVDMSGLGEIRHVWNMSAADAIPIVGTFTTGSQQGETGVRQGGAVSTSAVGAYIPCVPRLASNQESPGIIRVNFRYYRGTGIASSSVVSLFNNSYANSNFTSVPSSSAQQHIGFVIDNNSGDVTFKRVTGGVQVADLNGSGTTIGSTQTAALPGNVWNELEVAVNSNGDVEFSINNSVLWTGNIPSITLIGPGSTHINAHTCYSGDSGRGLTGRIVVTYE